MFINGLLVEVAQAGLGIELGEKGKIGGLLFGDDFVGVSDSWKQLQKHTDVVYSYCRKWRLKANVNKSAIRTLSRVCTIRQLEVGTGTTLVIQYTYLGIMFIHDRCILKRCWIVERMFISCMHYK